MLNFHCSVLLFIFVYIYSLIYVFETKVFVLYLYYNKACIEGENVFRARLYCQNNFSTSLLKLNEGQGFRFRLCFEEK